MWRMTAMVVAIDRGGRWRAWVRLSAYVMALQLLLGGLALRVAQASTDRALTRLGGVLMQYAGAAHQQHERTLMLNGAQIRLSVGTTDDSVSTVLDDFQRQCNARSGGLGSRMRELATQRAPRSTAPVDQALDGVLRVDDATRGVVACLDTGVASVSIDELASRARAFLATGDASVLGRLRFVSAERGDETTVFVALWNEGPLNISAMFPATGDAPGHDCPHVPRPDGSRRLMSAWEAGQRPSLAVYEVSAQSLSQTSRRFRQRLIDAGFRLPERAADDSAGVVATRGDASVVVAFAAADATRTFVTISSLSDATSAVTTR